MAQPLRKIESESDRLARSDRDMSPSGLPPVESGPRRASIVMGTFWMVGVTLALFFLPLINGLIGGLVGGYQVGGVRRALIAAILPAVAAAAGLWLLFVAFDFPVIGLLAGGAAGVMILLSDLGIFIGAAIGGAMSNRSRSGALRGHHSR